MNIATYFDRSNSSRMKKNYISIDDPTFTSEINKENEDDNLSNSFLMAKNIGSTTNDTLFNTNTTTTTTSYPMKKYPLINDISKSKQEYKKDLINIESTMPKFTTPSLTYSKSNIGENYNTAKFQPNLYEEKELKKISSVIEKLDLNGYLKKLMKPRILKISIDSAPFQNSIFLLSLKFSDKSSVLENFLFEWLDIETLEMVGYIRCEFIKHVHKQPKNRFCIACSAPKKNSNENEQLHYIYIECKSTKQCDLYVNGLQNICNKYHEDLKLLKN